MSRSKELSKDIEEFIVMGVIRPGERLDEGQLATRFGVSRTPIREALNQLASMGVVELRPRRGAFVPEVGFDRLIEMFEVMAEFEAMAGRLAARRMTDPDRSALTRAHEACEDARRQQDPDLYFERNAEFHNLIYNGSHNSFLAERAVLLLRRLGAYRRLQLRVRGRMESSFKEHEQILQAILDGDSARAGESLRQHVIVQGERFADLVALLRTPPAQPARTVSVSQVSA